MEKEREREFVSEKLKLNVKERKIKSILVIDKTVI